MTSDAEGSDSSRPTKRARLASSHSFPQTSRYSEDVFGKLGVKAVVFTIYTIQIAKAKIRYYWPSEETIKALQLFIERRPVLSSFLGLQLLSIALPTIALVIYASCSATVVAIGALLSLLTALGLGLCVFLPTVATIMFITFFVWLGGYSTYLGLWMAYTLYTEYCGRSGQQSDAKEDGEEEKLISQMGNDDSSTGGLKSTVASNSAESSANRKVTDLSLSTGLDSDHDSNGLRSIAEAGTAVGQLKTTDEKIPFTKNSVIEQEQNGYSKRGSDMISKEDTTQEEKVLSDIARSLQ